MYNSPKQETTHMSINRINKQIVLYSFNRMLVSNDKEWNADTCNKNENITSTWWFHSSEVLEHVKLTCGDRKQSDGYLRLGDGLGTNWHGGHFGVIKTLYVLIGKWIT